MFRLFGFDVHLRTGFLIFLGLIVLLYQSEFGIWLAGSLAGFTLLHELGHAVAARSAGAHAEISLDFLAGYTSFRPDPRRPLTRARRATISVAGPAVQIVASVAVLVAIGVNPVSIDSVRDAPVAAAAIWWAGPVIGALNLIPVLPLDGGHLLMTGLEPILGERTLRATVIASIALTIAGALSVYALLGGGFVIFVAFLLISQFQMLQATARPGSPRHPVQRSLDAEARAWQTGQPGILEPGQRLSPWYEAHRALTQGDPGGAMGVLLADLRSPNPGRWTPPTAATPEQLRAIVDVLPASPPAGNAYSSRVLAEVLLAVGEARRAGEYAAAAFGIHRTSPLATVVARAAAAMSDVPTATQWLRAAAEAASTEPAGYATLLGRTMDTAPELVALRDDPTFRAVRDVLPETPV